MEQYIQELHNTLAASPVGRSASSSFENVAVDTVAQLNALGYTAYNVNPQNVEEVEAALNTDLEQAGLPADGSYLILIEGEDEADTQGAISPHMDIKTSDEFKYTYNGKTYRMRWMSVYPNEYGGDSTMTVTTDDIIFFWKECAYCCNGYKYFRQGNKCIRKKGWSPSSCNNWVYPIYLQFSC